MTMLPTFILDRAQILDRLGGDEEIYAIMVDMFLQDVDNNRSALVAFLAEGDVAALCREAHTVKGLLATFSDDAGAAAAYALELQAKRGELAGAALAVDLLQARLSEVSAVLQKAQ